MAFEQLVAEAAAKKKSEKKGKEKKSDHFHSHQQDVAADAPNVPKA
jgi:hypothetical protein